MEDTFLNAFNEATAQEKAAQKAQGVTANINQQSYEQCINILQKYANGQVPEWDPKDLDTLLELLNDAGFSDKALQKINPILNNAKKQLQTSQSTNPNKTQEAPKQETESDVGTEEKSNPPAGGVGDPSKINDSDKNTLKNEIDRITSFGDGKASIDDLIAYLQTLKK
jgi:hypothetical protein